jgi:excisionase family DNA binding protein
MPEEMLDVAAAAQILGVGRTTVRYLIERGDLEAHRLPPRGRIKGHKLYLRRSQVEAVKDTWRRIKPRNVRQGPTDTTN